MIVFAKRCFQRFCRGFFSLVINFSKYCCVGILIFIILITVISFFFTIYSAIRYGQLGPVNEDLRDIEMPDSPGELLHRPLFLHKQRAAVGNSRRRAQKIDPYGETVQEERESNYVVADDPFQDNSEGDRQQEASSYPSLQNLTLIPLSSIGYTNSSGMTDELMSVMKQFEEVEKSFASSCLQTDRGVKANVFSSIHYRILPKFLCTGEVFLLYAVHSRGSHFQRRLAIRNTFGSLGNVDGFIIRLVFILATPGNIAVQQRVMKESEQYGDIVMGNFEEGFGKLVLYQFTAYHWSIHFCPTARYVTKLDDDTFINTIHLIEFLKYMPRSHFLYCSIARNRGPIRKKTSKWYIPIRQYSKTKFPPFCLGLGFVVSRDLIPRILGCASKIRPISVDDVFFTGLIARYAKISHHSFWNGHTFSWLTPQHFLPTYLSDNIFLPSKTNTVPVVLWKKIWKTAVLHTTV